jgi:hypothetical protein
MKIINKQVAVTAMGFGKNMLTIPRRMEFGGREIRFIGSGQHTVIRQDKMMSQIVTMSDGFQNFRLRSDNHGGSWTLLSIS